MDISLCFKQGSSLLVAVLVLMAPVTHADSPRYIFVNQAPGIEWNQARPETFTSVGFETISRRIAAPDNPQLRIGVSFMFSILETDAAVLCESLRALLKASGESGVPVLVILDGQQWWDARPDLWNWWNPQLPGYNPDNVFNVEWTSWDPASAVKIAWRNWGSQIRVRPAPNMASPKFLAANLERIALLAPIIRDWYERLPAEKKYLFGGVKVGNEAGTGYNAFYYPDGNHYLEQWPDDASHDPQTGLRLDEGLAGGVAQIGYAAVKTAGIKSAGAITRDDLAKVTQRYLAALAKAVHDCGIPTDLIFTHQGGTYPPWGVHIPFSTAFTECSTPGWSFYGLDPNTCEGLAKDMDDAHRTRWAAAEWWWGGTTKAEWRDHFERTLRFRDCRFIAVYNWDCGFSLKKDQAGQEALRELVAQWRE